MATSVLPSLPSHFPTTGEIKTAMEVAGASIEGAEYLSKRMRELIDENPKLFLKSPGLKDNLINAIDKFVEFVTFKHTAIGQPWSGQEVKSDVENLQENLARKAEEALKGKSVQSVRLDYAVSENGHYVRGYTGTAGELDADSVASLDKFYNAWLASKNYMIKGGFIYSLVNPGVKLNADEVRELMNDGSLAEYMEEKGVRAALQVRDYPGEEKEVQAKKDIEAAVDAAQAPEESQEPTVEMEQETPQSGVSTR